MAVRRGKRSHYLLLVTLLFTPSLLTEDQIRLAGPGSSRCSGRVEVYHNRRWGTVCDNEWDWSDAKVVCRQLDCGTVVSWPKFGQGTGQIWLDNVRCSGNESSLTQCQHNGFGIHNCDHNKDAGVICSDEIRLVGPGSSLCSGRVEVHHNKQWGTVCDDDWDMSDAEVVCKHLDCEKPLMAISNAKFDQGTGPIWLDDVGCSGSESSLLQCQHKEFGSHNCDHSEDAGVICTGMLPKPSISLTPQEVTWGQSVNVTCSINGLSQGTFSLRLLKQDVQTSGSNPTTFSLSPVTFDNVGPYYCVYQSDFSGETFRSPPSDSVLVTMLLPTPSISVTPSHEVVWGQTGVNISCTMTAESSGGTFTLRHLHQDVQTSGSTRASFSLPPVTFDSAGPYHCQYHKLISDQAFTSPQSESVTLQVSVVLPEPSLCVSSAAGEQQCSSDAVHISRGQAFVLSCSVHSPVPEGHFVLIFSGSNGSVSEPAVNHSASFHFPESQSEHQGEYRCVYQVTGAGRTYTSETIPTSIFIKVPVMLLVAPSVVGGLLLIGLVLLLLLLLLKKRSRDEQTEINLHAHHEAANHIEDSEEDERDYVNVVAPKSTNNKNDSNRPARSNPYAADVICNADGAQFAGRVRFVKHESSFEEEEEDDDYENVTERDDEGQCPSLPLECYSKRPLGSGPLAAKVSCYPDGVEFAGKVRFVKTNESSFEEEDDDYESVAETDAEDQDNDYENP